MTASNAPVPTLDEATRALLRRTTYRCDTCNRLLDDDAIVRRPETITTEFWGVVATTCIGESLYCRCGGEVFEVEVQMCARCEDAEVMVGSDFCVPCDAIEEQKESAAIRRKSREARHAELLSVLVDVARGTP